MGRKSISPAKAGELVQGLINGEDTEQLLTRLKISANAMTVWLSRPRTIEALAAKCLLSDLQAALVVSRYRTIAATRLIQIASENEGADVARKACADLLKTDLTRTAEQAARLVGQRGAKAAAGDGAGDSEQAMSWLRRALYGGESARGNGGEA